MKKFLDFIKEEIDLRGNSGVPRDFMRNSEEEAARNLNVRVDDEGQMRTVYPAFMELAQESGRLLMQGNDGRPLNREQLEQRVTALQNLAKDVIMDEYGDILDSSSRPVELDIRMVMPGQVNRNVPDLGDVPQNARAPREDETHEEEDKDEDSSGGGCSGGSCPTDGGETPNDEDSDDAEDNTISNNVLNAAMKKKILNMLTQGEGKATKDIIKYSPIVENGLQRIFGANGARILRIWGEMSDTADKMDWIVPVQNKANMMSNHPGGMAGATDVTWESINNSQFSIELLKENQDYKKITIKAVGVDFPMLIHEAVKGIYLLIQSAAIKKDKEFAKKVKSATSSFLDEAQDFRYGVTAQLMFNSFINACKDANKYTQMRTRVFRLLANDKDRLTTKASDVIKTNREMGEILKKEAALALTDERFLEVFNSLFSVFDKRINAGKIEFVINTERFNDSEAKKVIEKMIAYIVETEEAYEKALSEWEMEQKFGPSNYDDNDDSFTPDVQVPNDDKKEEPVDDGTYSDEDLKRMRQSEIQELVDDALDNQNYAEVQRLTKYLREGAEIYLRELERINENKRR